MVYYRQIPNTSIRLRNTDIIAAKELADRLKIDIRKVYRAYVVTWALAKRVEPLGGLSEWASTFSSDVHTAKEQLDAWVTMGSAIGILELDGLPG